MSTQLNRLEANALKDQVDTNPDKNLFKGDKNSLALAAALETYLQGKSTQLLGDQNKRESSINDKMESIFKYWKEKGSMPSWLMSALGELDLYLGDNYKTQKGHLKQYIQELEVFLGHSIEDGKDHGHSSKNSHSSSKGGALSK